MKNFCECENKKIKIFCERGPATIHTPRFIIGRKYPVWGCGLFGKFLKLLILKNSKL